MAARRAQLCASLLRGTARARPRAIPDEGVGLVVDGAELKPGDVALSIPREAWAPFSAAAARERAAAARPAALQRLDDAVKRAQLADSAVLAAELAARARNPSDPFLASLPGAAEIDVPAVWPQAMEKRVRGLV